MKKNLHILLIEDDPVDVFRLRHELRHGGLAFRSCRVQTREDFLKVLQSDPPDVILSDHGLPSFDGFTALDIVQKRYPRIPFIFVTAASDQAMMIEMFDGGAAGYVCKSRITELVPTLRQILAETGKRQQDAATPTGMNAPAAAVEMPAIATGVQPILICAGCKQVRGSQAVWMDMGTFFRENREATVSLSWCPACAAAALRHP